MSPSPLNPETLAENPQLGILAILQGVLENARLALLEAHSDIWDELSEACYHGTGAEYSVAMVHQINALEGTLAGYFESLERERLAHWRRQDSNKPNDNF